MLTIGQALGLGRSVGGGGCHVSYARGQKFQ